MISHRTKNLRIYTVISITNLTALFLALAVWGKEYYSSSVDIAHHYGLVQTIALKGLWINTPLNAYLGGMQFYPPVSHVVAAIVGQLTGSIIEGMFLVSLISLFGTYLLICWMIRFNQLIPTVVSSAVFLILLGCFHWTNAFIGGEIIDNFFFAQLFGLFIYIGSIYILAVLPVTFTMKGILSVLITFAMGWVFPFSAAQFAAASLVLQFLSILNFESNPIRFPWQFVIRFTIQAVLLCFASILHPTFAFMRRVGRSEGGITVFVSPELSVILLTLILASMIGISIRLFMRSDLGLSRPTVFIASVSGICAASITQFIAFYLANIGSHYGIEKHLFVTATFSAATISVLAAYPLRQQITARFKWIGIMLPTITALSAFAIVLPKHGTLIAPLAEYQKSIAHIFNYNSIAESHTVSANQHLSPMENFIVSTGDLHYDIAAALGFNIDPKYLGDAYPEILAAHPILFEFITEDAGPPKKCLRKQLSNNILLVDYACMKAARA